MPERDSHELFKLPSPSELPVDFVERRSEQRAVWTVDVEPPVTEQVRDFFADAASEIGSMTVEDLLTEDLIAKLAGAAGLGVSIEFSGISPAVQERIQVDFPGATMFESLWVWSDTRRPTGSW